ncbi:uncharacterized protein LTR77_008396 [Saxophila tyrrhenica]|uniref:Uncharacterized protein n=1 Tax=Saxophila tyrrhenica TaxID=1690608 RepID=A0AAV9P4I2_9PEZI|nr:hypothetical protein LTR77_008396 [Saxophila tyrrhenica]
MDTEASSRIGEDLRQAWMVARSNSASPEKGRFRFIPQMFEIQQVAPPGGLAEDGVARVANAYLIARGFDPSEAHNWMACTATVCTALRDANPGLRFQPRDGTDEALFQELSDIQEPKRWRVPGRFQTSDSSYGVVLVDNSEDHGVVRGSEHLTILLLLNWFEAYDRKHGAVRATHPIFQRCSARLAPYRIPPSKMSEAAITDVTNPTAKELHCARASLTGEDVTPFENKFRIMAKMVAVPTIEPPGRLGGDAMNSLTNTFRIARGLDPGDAPSIRACVESLRKTIEEVTPSMFFDPRGEEGDLLERVTFGRLCDSVLGNHWRYVGSMDGAGATFVDVVSDPRDTGLYPGNLLRSIEQMTILKRLVDFTELEKPPSIKCSLLSIKMCRARLVSFELAGHDICASVTRWFD